MLDETPAVPEEIAHLARLLKILAEPNRLLILNLLMQGTQCNCKLGDALQMAPNLISHHLGILREAGLVNLERDALDARWVYYSINQKTFEELSTALAEFLSPKCVPAAPRTCQPEPSALKLDRLSVWGG